MHEAVVPRSALVKALRALRRDRFAPSTLDDPADWIQETINLLLSISRRAMYRERTEDEDPRAQIISCGGQNFASRTVYVLASSRTSMSPARSSHESVTTSACGRECRSCIGAGSGIAAVSEGNIDP